VHTVPVEQDCQLVCVKNNYSGWNPPFKVNSKSIQDSLLAYQLFSFAVEGILKEIADNFAELINESTHFCSRFFCRL